jgi:hypothetical protein
MNVGEASGLGKRYGGTWALRGCTLAIPAGRVAALAGPTGAGPDHAAEPGGPVIGNGYGAISASVSGLIAARFPSRSALSR